jgi:hypothetical protein
MGTADENSEVTETSKLGSFRGVIPRSRGQLYFRGNRELPDGLQMPKLSLENPTTHPIFLYSEVGL